MAVGWMLGRQLTRAATVGVGLVALLAALAARSRTGDANTSTRPRVAIAIDVKDADSTTAWLADGLPQMMMSELSRSPEVEIVPPAQVRALLRRRGNGRPEQPGCDDLRDLARRLRASPGAAGDAMGARSNPVATISAPSDVGSARRSW